MEPIETPLTKPQTESQTYIQQKHEVTPPREKLADLFARYVRGPMHAHTRGFNPEGQLEATLTLEQQMKYATTITEGTDAKPPYPLEFMTVTDHAEHLGLNTADWQRWKSEGKLTQDEVSLITTGVEKRKIPKNDPRAAGVRGSDGWGLCTEQENAAMAKAAALSLEEMALTVKALNGKPIIHPGVEASITPNGELTIQDVQVLRKLDVVIASPHASGFDHEPLAPDPEQLINVYMKVIRNQPILILGHPFIDKPIASALQETLKKEGWVDAATLKEKKQIARRALDGLVGPLLDLCRDRGVAFELNLKSPLPRSLQEAMIILLEQHNTPISIGIDFHQIQAWRDSILQKAEPQVADEPDQTGDEVTQEETNLIKKVRAGGQLDPLQRIYYDVALAKEKAVGVRLPLRLGRLLRQLSLYGIDPGQIITSSEEVLLQAIDNRRRILNAQLTNAQQ